MIDGPLLSLAPCRNHDTRVSRASQVRDKRGTARWLVVAGWAAVGAVAHAKSEPTLGSRDRGAAGKTGSVAAPTQRLAQAAQQGRAR